MEKNELIQKAKLRIRKTANGLDEDVGQLVEVALEDLKRIGVDESHLEDIENPILIEAVLIYVHANFGNPENQKDLLELYDMMLTKIKGGKAYRNKRS